MSSLHYEQLLVNILALYSEIQLCTKHLTKYPVCSMLGSHSFCFSPRVGPFLSAFLYLPIAISFFLSLALFMDSLSMVCLYSVNHFLCLLFIGVIFLFLSLSIISLYNKICLSVRELYQYCVFDLCKDFAIV